MIKRIVRKKESSSSGPSESLSSSIKKMVGRNKDCSLCSLGDSARTPCFWGQGSGEVMVIAEAPTAAADRSGRILEGPPGKLLKETLEAVGITQFYFTHRVKCTVPEDGKISNDHLKTCLRYLDREILMNRPKFILTLGATALKGLIKGKITEVHGQTLEYKGVPLFPTFHPAIALRDPSKLPTLRKDLVKFGNLVRGEEERIEDIHWEIIRTFDQWNSFIEEYIASPEVAIDTETTGLDENAEEWEVSFGRETFRGKRAVNSLQVSLKSGRNFALPLGVRDSPWKPAQQKVFIETLVELSEGKTVVMWNGKFDNRWIKKCYGVKFRNGFDGMLAHHTLDENSEHGLKPVSMEYCGAPAYDVDLKTKLGLGNLEEFYKYGCYDTYYTLRLYYIFRAKFLKDQSLRRLFYRLVMPAARMFEDVEEVGHYIDVKKLAETKKTLEQRMSDLMGKLDNIAAGVNWGSPKQVADLFYGRLGLPILEKTASGAPSTGESVLKRLDHPVAKMLVEHRGIAKNLSTYVDGWKELMHGPYLYISTKLHGTVTGRYASRLHQVPRDPAIRSHIIAPPGYTLVVADYSQIELRLAAMAANDPRMKAIFQTNGDIHAATASEILGKDPKTLTKEERKMGKPVNFGFLYGMGWSKFGIYARDNYGVIFSDSESKEYRQRFFEIYSALPAWHERQRRCVRAFGQVVSLSGRIRRLPGINSSDKGVRAEAERQGINSPIQGFGSGDLKAMAMIEIHETFPLDEVRIKGEVHDSILMWIRDDLVAEYIPQIKAIMEHPKLLEVFGINMTVPLLADFEVGPWGLGEKWE